MISDSNLRQLGTLAPVGQPETDASPTTAGMSSTSLVPVGRCFEVMYHP
jgi:hypothetical protein